MPMKEEIAYGIIPLSKNHTEVLIIQHAKGAYWSFPKGHEEPDESPQQTAKRELHEETGLIVLNFLNYPPLHEDYTFVRDGQNIHKSVTYFIAEVSRDLHLQEGEVLDAKWCPLSDLENLMTFEEGKKLAKQLLEKEKEL